MGNFLWNYFIQGFGIYFFETNSFFEKAGNING